MKQHIQFGSKRIDFTLSFASRKTMAIKIHPDASVEVIFQYIEKKKIFQKLKRKHTGY